MKNFRTLIKNIIAALRGQYSSLSPEIEAELMDDIFNPKGFETDKKNIKSDFGKAYSKQALPKD